MDLLRSFVAYADEFEKTYMDDQWDRLRKYFHEDATYEVNSKSHACRLQGPDAIFAGIKKSLDGFDRKFEQREIAVIEAPIVDGDTFRASWVGTYKKGDFEPLVLPGRSVAEYKNGKIAKLSEYFEPEAERAVAQWIQSTGFDIDLSYT